MAQAQQKTVFDTDRQYLGSVYAKALVGATENAGNTEAALADLEAIVAELLDDKLPLLDAALSSPRVPVDAKYRVLDNAFGDKVPTELLNFLKIVCERGRFDCLRAIAQAARARYNELRGRTEVFVSSAEPLDEDTLALVTSKLQASLGCEVDLKQTVAPEIIGGLVLRIGDTVYDGSVSNRLLKIREDMVSKTTQTIRGEIDRFATAE